MLKGLVTVIVDLIRADHETVFLDLAHSSVEYSIKSR
jgi:hypothetical protein